MRIAEIMNTSIEKASPVETAELAWERMKRRRIHHLVVVDGHDIVGIVSAHDLGGSEAGTSARKGRSVADVMSPKPVVVDEDATIRQVANKLRGRSIGCLPITRDGDLVGIITTTDLLSALGRGAQRPVVQGKRWTLKHRGPRSRPAARGGAKG